MKRVILVLALLLFPAICFAAERVVIVNGTGNEIGPTKSEAVSVSDAGSQDALITGAATIYSVNVYGATAGDIVGLYDKLSMAGATTTPILEVAVSANTSSNSISIPGGVKVSNGVTAVATDTDVVYSVIYEQ